MPEADEAGGASAPLEGQTPFGVRIKQRLQCVWELIAWYGVLGFIEGKIRVRNKNSVSENDSNHEIRKI